MLRAWERQSNFSAGLRRAEAARGIAASTPNPRASPATRPLGCSTVRLTRNPPGAGVGRRLPHLPQLPGSPGRTSLGPRRSACARAASTRCRPFLGPWRVFSVWPHITSRKGERGGGGTSSLPSTSRFLLSPQGAPPPDSARALCGRLLARRSQSRRPCRGVLLWASKGSRTLHLAYIRSPLAFPGKCETLVSCFRLETQT